MYFDYQVAFLCWCAVKHQINKWINESIIQSTNQPTKQPTNQPTNQATNHQSELKWDLVCESFLRGEGSLTCNDASPPIIQLQRDSLFYTMPYVCNITQTYNIIHTNIYFMIRSFPMDAGNRTSDLCLICHSFTHVTIETLQIIKRASKHKIPMGRRCFAQTVWGVVAGSC